MQSDTYRPEVSQSIWNFLATRVDHENVSQIAKDLKQYSISIALTNDEEKFLIRGSNEGIIQCKQRLSQLAKLIVEREKKLEYPGIKNLFFDQVGKQQLEMIEKEMKVDIKSVCCSAKKILKEPVPLPRASSFSKIKPGSSVYNICKFTTKEGVKVTWKYGSIEYEKADVLVNSARSNLNHPTACGKALMVCGGPYYKEACRPHTNIRPGDVVVTDSGALLSKYVVHAVCRNIMSFQEAVLAHQFIKGLVRKILEKCEEIRASSLAMPLIGTGQHGFPEESVLEVIKYEVEDFSERRGDQLNLRNICVIVFQSVTLPNTPQISNVIAFKEVSIYLFDGNVGHCQADSLMKFSSTDISFSTTASQCTNTRRSEDAIKPLPGTVLVRESCTDKDVKYYLHCIPTSFDTSGLENTVKAGLNAARFYAQHSVLISATGIASFGVAPQECADIILKASKIFSISNFRMDVKVVVFDADVMQIFQDVFKERAKERQVRQSFCEGDQGESSVAINHQRPMTIGTKDEVLFRLVGFHDSVNMASDKIEAYFNRAKTKKCISGDKIVNRLWNRTSEIKEISKKYEVFITFSAEELFIEGMTEQVFECKDALTDFLSREEEKKREKRKSRKISQSLQWSYSHKSGSILFDENLNGMIEREFKVGNNECILPSSVGAYKVDLANMVIIEIQTGLTALLARRDLENMSVPIIWEPQTEHVHLVKLSTSSNEYQQVIDLIGPAKISVECIERIQNPRLYKMYLSKKESMGTEANEMQLFHGTKSESVSSINTNNFNRGFSGRNGTRYGCGVYFARDASYSIRYSRGNSEHDSDFYMYVAKVLVGKSIKGDGKLRVLPKRNDPHNPELFYDSAVDDTENPSIFVTFDDHQCYPEYLITFKMA